MMKNILKVYDEDLLKGALNTVSLAQGSAVMAGQTQGALCVNVFAVGDVDVKHDVTVKISHGAREDGEWAEVAQAVIPTGSKFEDDTLMASVVLPTDVCDFVVASATSHAENIGNIKVTLGYLAR